MMANGDDDPRVYQALALPEQALERGGLEILRIGLIDDDLYVSARPSLRDHAQWGEVLAEVARRLGAIYAAQSPGLTKKDVSIAIAEAFVADFGAQPVKPVKKTAKKTAQKAAKKTAKTSPKSAARRKKR